jgi:hypothetical protein
MKKFIVLCILAQLLFSCDFLDFFGPYDGNNNYEGLGKDEFYAKNFSGTTITNYKLKASLLAEGRYCNVWVENSAGVGNATAQGVADAYDNNIYKKMIDTFSIRDFSFLGYNFSDIMEFADFLTDEDGKLTILLLDIKDGYRKGVNEAYYAGYFWSGDIFPNDPNDKDLKYSNERDMIYIDTYPGMSTDAMKKEAYSTLAHEMQHLMNLVTTFVERSTVANGKITSVSPMNTWIDEGLASAAEWLYADNQKGDRIDWFNNNGEGTGSNKISGLINKGNNFFVWNNRTSENPYANLDDYATVYIFFQWLRLQTSTPAGTSIYKDIITSEYNDYTAVLTAFNKNVSANKYANWGALLKDWMAANYINASTGRYGYMNEPYLKDLKASTITAGTTTVDLYPGEGVYSKTSSAGSTYPQGTTIMYAGLNKTSPQVSDSNVFANGALLTYNINTIVGGSAEKGTTTGVALSVDAASPEGRSARPFTGPYRIDAGDLLRRGGNDAGVQSMDFSGLLKGLEVDE